MTLDILTPEKTIFTGEISLVKVPGSNGSFEIMESHAPIISSLSKGELKINTKDEKVILYNIDGGVIEVNNNKVIILVEKILE